MRTALRRGGEDIETLWIACTARGQPHRVVTRQPAGVSYYAVPVAELRDKIAVLVSERLARGPRN